MPYYPGQIYNRGGTDKTVIVNIRTFMGYPWEAPGWTDLRAGFFLSITDLTNNNLITGLEETIAIPVPGHLDSDQRYWIGLKNRDTQFPKYNGTVFIGFSNASPEPRRPDSMGDSVLASSDLGIGTTNTNFWRPHNSRNANWSAGVWEGSVIRTPPQDGVQQHFAQDTTGAGGYATLLALRLQRDSGNSRRVTVTTKAGTHSADVMFSNVTDLEFLKSKLIDFPTTVQQWGPYDISEIPTALYCYWPFITSRLRVHSCGVFRAR